MTRGPAVRYSPRVHRWVLLLCGLWGCIQETSSGSARPPDIDLIAKIGFELETRAGVNDGGLTLALAESDSTGLTAVQPETPLVTTVTDELAWFAVGYRSSDLQSSRPPADPADLVAARVQRATAACGLLPPPAWRVPLNAQADPYDDDFAAVDLRTDWSRVCPATPVAWLDIRCAAAPACGTLPRFSGCEVRYDAKECLDTAITVEREIEGGACFVGDTGCTSEPNSEGGLRWTCPRCEIETYAPHETRDVRADLEVIVAEPLDDAARARHSSPWPLPRDMERGGAAAMSFRDGRLWVAPRAAEETFNGLCESRTTAHNGLLNIYDESTLDPSPDALQQVTSSTAVAHRCYTRLVPDHHGAGMLATYYVDGEAYVGRLDARGRTLSAVELPRRATSLPVRAMTAFLVTSSEHTAVLEVLELQGDATVGSYHVLDSRSLTRLASRSIDLPVKGLSWVKPGHTEVDIIHTNGVVRVDTRTGDDRGEGAFTAGGVLGLGVALARSALALDNGQVLLPDSRLSAGVVLFAPRQGDLAPISVSRLPGLTSIILQPVMIQDGPDALALALTAEQPVARATLARIELSPERARVRPGAWRVLSRVVSRVGREPPVISVLTQPLVDERGRLWVLASWEGRVLRFDALPRP